MQTKNKRYCLMLLCLISILMMAHNLMSTENLVEEYEPIVTFPILDKEVTPYSPKRKVSGNVVQDNLNSDLRDLISKGNTTYIIRHKHKVDSITIPKGVQLHFDGGSIEGKICFKDTYLSGKVNLCCSVLSGKISNSCFHSGWLCYGDGIHDDAANINNMISICDSIVFQKGTYLLTSVHVPNMQIENSLRKNVLSHIGIYESHKHLQGTDSVVFLTKDEKNTCSVYSIPNNIPNSIRNISIRNIIFKVENDKKNFNEFSHTIKLMGVDSLLVENCTFHDFWGDAICLSHYGDTPSTGERTRNSNVRILNNMIYGGSHNNRNGISVISGQHVWIVGNQIYETCKKGMPGAIDVEPNNSVYTVKDIIIRNNIISGSAGAGICLVSQGEGAPFYDIIISANKVSKVVYGIAIVIETDNSTANIKICDNVFIDTRKDYNFSGKGNSRNWEIRNNSSTPSFELDIKKGLSVSDLCVECM